MILLVLNIAYIQGQESLIFLDIRSDVADDFILLTQDAASLGNRLPTDKASYPGVAEYLEEF
jgi:hypothetical protein